MARLLSLLMILALVLTNGASVAAAVCQHADAQAHASALLSVDAETAADAQAEDRAARNALQKGTLVDAAAVQLAGFMLPPEVAVPAPVRTEPIKRHAADERVLANRAVSPLLEPPLA